MKIWRLRASTYCDGEKKDQMITIVMVESNQERIRYRKTLVRQSELPCATDLSLI
ncbi:MAG: hypothetical protein ACLTKE_01765 [Coprococcus sp.]